MIKYLLIICLFLFAADASANSFFDNMLTSIDRFWEWMADVPSFIDRFFIWFYEWYLKALLYAKFSTVKIYYSVANTYLTDLSVYSLLQGYLTALPNDVQYALKLSRMMDAFMLVFEAYVTRFLMRL